jgi:hypothetical protein
LWSGSTPTRPDDQPHTHAAQEMKNKINTKIIPGIFSGHQVNFFG